MAKSNLLAEVAALQNKIRAEIQFHRDEIAILEGLLGSSGASAPVRRGRPPKSASSQAPAKKGKRIRQSAEQIQAQAVEVLKTIKAAGSEGISSGDLIAKHPNVKFNPSVVGWLKKYSDGGYKTKGKKQFTTFHAG